MLPLPSTGRELFAASPVLLQALSSLQPKGLVSDEKRIETLSQDLEKLSLL